MRVIDTFTELLPAKLQPYAKAIAALILGCLTVAAGLAGAPTWVPLLLAVLQAPAVFLVENREATTEEPVADTELVEDEEYVPAHAA